MTATEYLSQAYMIDQRINAKLEQVMSLRNTASRATSLVSDMPRSSTPNVCRMEDIILKFIDTENEINAEIDQLVDLKREVRSVISQINHREYQTLLELRYLCFKTWDQIGDLMNYSTKYIFELHERALKKIKVPKKDLTKTD